MRLEPGMTTHRRALKRWTPGAIVLFCAGLSCGPHAGLDEELRTRFLSHRAEFDSLAAMAVADTQLVGGCRDGTSFRAYVRDTPEHNRLLPPGELEATGRSGYGRLLERAGVPCLSRAREGTRIWFTVASGSGATRGIVHSQVAPTPVRESLGDPRSSGPAYVPLAPGWFLFVEPRD